MFRPLETAEDWSAHLRAIATPALLNTPLTNPRHDRTEADAFRAGFTDERGHRRPIDEPLLRRLLRQPAPAPPEATATDAAAWWALADPNADDVRLESLFLQRDAGPVIPEDPNTGVEIWTETELAALHALANHAADASDSPVGPALLARARAAAAWHVETIQPDNATNHPWAAHLFAAVSIATASDEHRLHAETLVNICCVSTGQPDRFSATLLLDAADSIQKLTDLFAA